MLYDGEFVVFNTQQLINLKQKKIRLNKEEECIANEREGGIRDLPLISVIYGNTYMEIFSKSNH